MRFVTDNVGYYTLYDVFNFGKIQGGNLFFNNIGWWDLDNGLHLEVDLNEYKYYRRWNFQNWTMRMILVVSNTNIAVYRSKYIYLQYNIVDKKCFGKK